jgi:hypothetical protein
LNCDIDTLNARKNDLTPLYQAFPYTKTSAWLNESIDTIGHEIGVPAETVEELFNSFLGEDTTVRDVLQKIGTELIRKYNPLWHVNKLVENIKNAESNLVVVDDIRFPNEREAVEKLGGQVFFIIRPDLTVQVSQHSSETSLFWHHFDDKHILLNYSTEKFLCEQFTEIYDMQFFLTGSCPILKSYYDEINGSKDEFGPDSLCIDPETNEIIKFVLTCSSHYEFINDKMTVKKGENGLIKLMLPPRIDCSDFKVSVYSDGVHISLSNTTSDITYSSGHLVLRIDNNECISDVYIIGLTKSDIDFIQNELRLR